MKNKQYPLYEVTDITSIADMLEKKAERIPEKTAFRFRKGRDGIETRTFEEVYVDAKRAASLLEKNFGKGKHIAVIGENSYEWLIAFFAVWVRETWRCRSTRSFRPRK